ncbi:MAG: hypothetical protein QXI36_03310, partial [Candidatus Bathyarchaeia archaeon]
RVGSKAELFPPKEIREKLKLYPRKRVIYRVQDGKFLVEPIPSLEEVLEEPPLIEITFEEFRTFRKDLSREIDC